MVRTPRARPVSRRRCLALLGGAAAAWPASGHGRERPGGGLVILDWGLAQTALALGVAPTGVPAPAWYDRYAVSPLLPAEVTDVGLLFAPNFEVIEQLRPERILVPATLAPAVPLLRRIAPTDAFSVFSPGPELLDRARAETGRLAALLDRKDAFSELDRRTSEAIGRAAAVPGHADRPLYVLSLLDERHVSIFGPQSLFGAVVERIGARNAWSAPGGAGTPAGLEALAERPDASLVIVRSSLADGLEARLAASPFWNALPFAREGRAHVVDPVMSFGGLPAAERFAALLADALAPSRS